MFRKAVIDTGPLFSALVLNYTFGNGGARGPARFTSALGPALRDKDSQEQFLGLLGSINEKLTTSHVIGELYGLQASRLKLHGDDRRGFWRAGIDLLMQWNVDERLIRLLDLAADENFGNCVPEIGPTDTGLIQLALQHGCVLITADARTLAPKAWAVGVDCHLVDGLLPPKR